MRYKTFRAIVALVGLTVIAAVAAGVFWAMSVNKPRRAVDPEAERRLQARREAQARTRRTPPVSVASTPAATAPAGSDALASAGDPAAPGEPAAGAASDSVPLRPMDEEILARVQRGLTGGKGKDVFPGKKFKVNLYQDAGFTYVNRLKIDLDRDEKWDEKWTFVREEEQEEVKRQVAPADDDVYTEEYRLRAGAWARKVRAD